MGDEKYPPVPQSAEVARGLLRLRPRTEEERVRFLQTARVHSTLALSDSIDRLASTIGYVWEGVSRELVAARVERQARGPQPVPGGRRAV